MSWFTKAFHTVTHFGGEALHTAESTGEDIGDGIASVATDAGHVVVEGADDIGHGVTSAADAIASTGSKAFDTAVHTGEETFDKVEGDLERALKAGEAAILSAAAKSKVEELEPIIEELRSVWKEIRSEVSGDLALIKEAAMGRSVTTEAEEALARVARNGKLAGVLGKFFSKSYASFGFEFGASAAFGVGVEAALGVVAGLPDVADIRGYGSVGGSAGASGGGEVDESLVVNLSSPAGSGGPYASVIISLEAEVGGTVVVSFNLPDFSFGGVSIGLGEGAEVSVAVGAGYTFVF